MDFASETVCWGEEPGDLSSLRGLACVGEVGGVVGSHLGGTAETAVLILFVHGLPGEL